MSDTAYSDTALTLAALNRKLNRLRALDHVKEMWIDEFRKVAATRDQAGTNAWELLKHLEQQEPEYSDLIGLVLSDFEDLGTIEVAPDGLLKVTDPAFGLSEAQTA